MRRPAAVLAGLAATAFLAAPAGAARGQLSVSVSDGADAAAVQKAVASATGGRLVANLGPLDTLVFTVDDLGAASARAARVRGVGSVERLGATRWISFSSNDPLRPKQWYLNAVNAFDFWPDIPVRPAVRVAVIDSGIDGGHPDLAGKVVGSKSFVPSPALKDTVGHGTAVAGEIAAHVDNAKGIAGAGIPVELLIGKVVRQDGSISVLAEAKAIRWAVDSGAEVINLSLGGPRDPRRPRYDDYSPLEHAAVDYATRNGVLVVAAAGNCTTFKCPEQYASWPAALPHVVAVSALNRSNSAPYWSNRDALLIDVAAPGADILSTFPRALTKTDCSPRGYTSCSRDPAWRKPAGTSFAAPLVAAAAAVVIAERAQLGLPKLAPNQVATLIEHSAKDLGAGGHDKATGHGRLDIAAALTALSGPIPAADAREPNDALGRAARLGATVKLVQASLDRFDDARDVYRISLGKNQRITLDYQGPSGGVLYLWRADGSRAAISRKPGSKERIVFRAKRAGKLYVEARLPSGPSGGYSLTLTRG